MNRHSRKWNSHQESDDFSFPHIFVSIVSISACINVSYLHQSTIKWMPSWFGCFRIYNHTFPARKFPFSWQNKRSRTMSLVEGSTVLTEVNWVDYYLDGCYTVLNACQRKWISVGLTQNDSQLRWMDQYGHECIELDGPAGRNIDCNDLFLCQRCYTFSARMRSSKHFRFKQIWWQVIGMLVKRLSQLCGDKILVMLQWTKIGDLEWQNKERQMRARLSVRNTK